MAITPNQARELAYPSDERQRQLQDYFDNALVEMQKTGYWHGISTEKLTAIEVNWMVTIYTASGWKVETYTDPRDGNFIHFSSPTDPRYDAMPLITGYSQFSPQK